MSLRTDLVPLRARRWMVHHLPTPVWRHLRPVVHGQTRLQAGLRDLELRMHEPVARRLGPDVRAVRTTDGTVFGQVVTSYDADAERRHQLGQAQQFLTDADVPWVLVDERPAHRSLLVVPSPHRGAALQTLHEQLAQSAAYLQPILAGRTIKPRLAGEPLPPSDDLEAVRIFRYLTTADGQVVEQGASACVVEFWEELETETIPVEGRDPVPAGTIVAPMPNRWIDHLKPDDWTPRTRLQDPTGTAPWDRHVFDLDEPVDVVYTWVDGSDPTWLQRREQAATQFNEDERRHPTASNESRFASHDELRYSLRSLEMYASWVRRVYLVTDNQVPSWLNTDHPSLRVVSHGELFADQDALPTFNSHAIESQLHHITGLSEYFLYLNDDVFIGRPISPALFFEGNGLTRFFPSQAKLDLGEIRAGEAPVMTAAKNNRRIINTTFGATVTNKLKHVPHALRTSVLHEMEERFSEAFETTSGSRFRHPDDYSIVSSLYHWYAYATGRAVPGSLRYFYADIGRQDTPARLDHLLFRRDYDTFCLNDHDSSTVDTRAQADMVCRFLSNYYPLPSSFELPGTETEVRSNGERLGR